MDSETTSTSMTGAIFYCQFCEYVCDSTELLEIHSNVNHSEEKPSTEKVNQQVESVCKFSHIYSF